MGADAVTRVCFVKDDVYSCVAGAYGTCLLHPAVAVLPPRHQFPEKRPRQIVIGNELVLASSQPLYPIDLVEEVAKDSEAYRKMLRP